MNPKPPCLDALNMREPTVDVVKRLEKEANTGLLLPPHVTQRTAIEFRRDQYGLTIEQWATKVLHVPTHHYQAYLGGTGRLSINALRRAAAVGVPLVALLGGRNP